MTTEEKLKLAQQEIVKLRKCYDQLWSSWFDLRYVLDNVQKELGLNLKDFHSIAKNDKSNLLIIKIKELKEKNKYERN